MVKSQYKQDLYYSSYKEKTATKLCWHVLKTLLFQYIPYFKTHLHLACLSSILKLTIQNTMKDHQTCNPVSSSVILSPGYHWYCGSFLWKWMRNNPSLDTSFLFSTKNPNDPDFFIWSCILVKKCTLNVVTLEKWLTCFWYSWPPFMSSVAYMYNCIDVT